MTEPVTTHRQGPQGWWSAWLGPEELARCWTLASQEICANPRNTTRRPFDTGQRQRQSDIYLGTIGELALRIILEGLGDPVEWVILNRQPGRADPGWDMVWRGLRVDAKTVGKPGNRLVYFPSSLRTSDLSVLLHVADKVIHESKVQEILMVVTGFLPTVLFWGLSKSSKVGDENPIMPSQRWGKNARPAEVFYVENHQLYEPRFMEEPWRTNAQTAGGR